MPLGKCKLCLNQGELLKSHLIPAAVSKLLRARQNPNPNPLVVTKDWIGQSSEQVAEYVFCRKCEDIFNDGGERWLIPRLASLDGFPLYEMLTSAQPFFQQDDLLAYRTSSIPGLEITKVVHFAMAVF